MTEAASRPLDPLGSGEAPLSLVPRVPARAGRALEPLVALVAPVAQEEVQPRVGSEGRLSRLVLQKYIYSTGHSV
jgi:hypothetical protein